MNLFFAFQVRSKKFFSSKNNLSFYSRITSCQLCDPRNSNKGLSPHSHLLLLSRPTVNPARLVVYSRGKIRECVYYFASAMSHAHCRSPPFPPFRRPHSSWLVGESLLKLMWPRTSGYTPGNEARIGLDFFSLLFSPFFSFPRGETVARDREKGWRSGWKAGKEREINYCHALNGCTCGLEASFFLSDAPGN